MTTAVQDLTIQAFLGLLILLLALSLTAVIRTPPMTGTTTAPEQQDEAGNLTLGWPAAAREPAPPLGAERSGRASAPRDSALAWAWAKPRRSQYAPRHVHGYVPPPPEHGPPWGPADVPPGQRLMGPMPLAMKAV